MSPCITPLVLCGGSGTRLWPASRGSRPKQFLALFGTRSPFQETLLRVADASLFLRPVVVTNSAHRFLVAEQLRAIDVEADVVLEPDGRDSGPAIAAGTVFIADRLGEDAHVLVLAADHMIRDTEGFRSSCVAALEASSAGRIVTFGVAPDRPATEYGYLECDELLAGEIRRVKRFVEKPDTETARRYVREGYLWNSGNFLFKAGVLLEEYAATEPATIEAVREAVANATLDFGFVHLAASAFARAEKRSVDYAVMERTTKAALAPATFDWSDIGSWSTVHALSPQDEAGNSARGKSMFVDARRNLVSSDGPLVCVVGLDDLAVIATGDAVLVVHRENSAGIKALVAHLKSSNESLTQDHLQCFRPWGNYCSLDVGSRHQVKRIVVKPGGLLSLQKHHHRSEHWIVVRGTAKVSVAGRVKTLHENESIYIPIGTTHRMENPGKIDLEIIEVQTGSYLGEDDIIRIEDIYHRVAS